jgi:L-threonylcarbamoyladenylate synthase
MPSRIIRMSRGSIQEATSVVKSGGLVVYPTDTVYGLGSLPFEADAVDRLMYAKGRERKPLPVLCSSAAKGQELVSFGPMAARLASRYWPGALTIVAPLRRQVPFSLDQGTGTLGVRVPRSDPCLELISSCDGFLVGTSANLSGNPPSRSAEEAFKQLGRSVDLILDGGRLEGLESTVVGVIGEELTVLRQGQVRVADEAMKR